MLTVGCLPLPLAELVKSIVIVLPFVLASRQCVQLRTGLYFRLDEGAGHGRREGVGVKVILMVGLVFVSGLERKGRTVATGEL